MIAAEINFKDETGAKGYWVGFFAHLERLIFAEAQRIDVFADIDQVLAEHAAIAARVRRESKPMPTNRVEALPP